MKQFARQIQLPEIGREGQQRLSRGSIAVIGAGGLGCPALSYLAASGIGTIGIVDHDCVEESNLARQILFSRENIGELKAVVAAEHLRAMYPDTRFETHLVRLGKENAQGLLAGYDIVLDGTDNSAARYAIDDACIALGKPWVYGSLRQWEGQVALFNGKDATYRTLFPEEGTLDSDCSRGGILGPTAGIIAMIQCLEAIKWLVGIEENLLGKLLLIDAKTWRFTQVRFKEQKQVDCAITHEELLLLQKEEKIELIDVRAPIRLELLPKDKILVFFCERGIRSKEIAKRLRREGKKAFYLLQSTTSIPAIAPIPLL